MLPSACVRWLCKRELGCRLRSLSLMYRGTVGKLRRRESAPVAGTLSVHPAHTCQLAVLADQRANPANTTSYCPHKVRIYCHEVSIVYSENPKTEPVIHGRNSTSRAGKGGHDASVDATSASCMSDGREVFNRGLAVTASVATSSGCVRMKAPPKSIQQPSTQHTTSTTIGGLVKYSGLLCVC